jgi:hypothetical protein
LFETDKKDYTGEWISLIVSRPMYVNSYTVAGCLVDWRIYASQDPSNPGLWEVIDQRVNHSGVYTQEQKFTINNNQKAYKAFVIKISKTKPHPGWGRGCMAKLEFNGSIQIPVTTTPMPTTTTPMPRTTTPMPATFTGNSKYDNQKFKIIHTTRSGPSFRWGKGTITFKGIPSQTPQYTYIGCFNDHSYLGKSRPLEYITRINKTNPDEIKNECMVLAKARSKDLFGIQDGNACMVGDSKTSPYSRDGASTTCTPAKLGTPWVNAVFKI